MTTETMIDDRATAEGLAERVFAAGAGALEAMGVWMGVELGLYQALDDGASTRDEIAVRTGTHWRYVGEWLEAQCASGIVRVDDPTVSAASRTYSLPAGHAEAVLDTDSEAYAVPFLGIVLAAAERFSDLVDAYRSGGGVSWEDFGAQMRDSQAAMNRPFYLAHIGTDWFPAVPALHDALVDGARVADIACGEGWSTIATALAYPQVTLDGYDVDGPSIEAARRNAVESGVADRVSFHHADAAFVEGTYDVVLGFEFLHDLPAPVDVLASMRRLAGPDGQVVIMDERVPETFSGEPDEIEALMYGFSLFVCLPDAMSHQPSAATGTVIRPSVVDGYARDAGFTATEILPIEADLWRFYRLVP